VSKSAGSEHVTGPAPEGAGPCYVHGTTVAWGPGAVLILGASGSGKSALALELMALGCVLVSDDQTVLQRQGAVLCARAPDALRGMIEARHVGLLAAEVQDSAIVTLVVDLSQEEGERLPPERKQTLLGLDLPLLYRVDAGYFPAAILQYLKGARRA
jgi:HPr kinase/phosphorylase